MLAVLDGHVIAASDNVVVCGGYLYFPPETVRREFLEPAEKTADDRACPHGVQFYDVMIAGVRHPRAAWSYQRTGPAMQHVGGWFGFWQDVEIREGEVH